MCSRIDVKHDGHDRCAQKIRQWHTPQSLSYPQTLIPAWKKLFFPPMSSLRWSWDLAQNSWRLGLQTIKRTGGDIRKQIIAQHVPFLWYHGTIFKNVGNDGGAISSQPTNGAISSPITLTLPVLVSFNFGSSPRSSIGKCFQQKSFHCRPALSGILQEILPAINARPISTTQVKQRPGFCERTLCVSS